MSHSIAVALLVAASFSFGLKYRVFDSWLSGSVSYGRVLGPVLACAALYLLRDVMTPDNGFALAAGVALILATGLVWHLSTVIDILGGLKTSTFAYGRLLGVLSFISGVGLLIHLAGF